MYEFIEGTLETLEPTYLVLNASGIGFRIFVANPYRWQDFVRESVRVYVELVTREDSQLLYGFKDQKELQLFQTLNKVSGIGPKSALAILAIDDHDGLIQAVHSSDSKYLMKFPGVGKKTAQQMILDLEGKLDDFAVHTSAGEEDAAMHDQQQLDEILEALSGLGYTQREIKRVAPLLEKESFATTQEGLSFAFKQLIK